MIWKQGLSSLLIASSVAVSAVPALAAEAAPLPAVALSYYINNESQAQVKSVLQEKTPAGWRIAAVVKLYNSSTSPTRIPDYELRALTPDGTPYLLQSSASNPKTIPPQSYAEFSYLAEPDTKADISITSLQLVDVNMEVYPKKETMLADIPVEAWKGNDAVISDPSLIKAWVEAFAIPGITSGLNYSAVSVTKTFSGQSPAYSVQVKVTNPGTITETVPDFTLGGKSAGATYIGKKAETTPVTLNPGDEKYIHFSIVTDNAAQLTSYYVLTPDSFLKQGQTTPLTYYVGRISFVPPTDEQLAAGANQPVYEFGQLMNVDRVSNAVNPQMSVSIMDMQWFENEGQQYRTAVASVKFNNNGNAPIPVPEIGADITDSNGAVFNGNRVNSTVKEVLPGMGTIVQYTFTTPLSESDNQFTFRLLEPEGQAAAAAGASTAAAAQPAVKSPIAQVPVSVMNTEPSTTSLAFYPYEMKLGSWTVTTVAGTNPTTRAYTYSYKVKMDLDIHTTDEAVVDPANPKIYMQLENGGSGSRLAYKTFPLAGDGRLLSGTQTINFDSASDQMESPLVLKIYESVTTPLGEARHLLAVLKAN